MFRLECLRPVPADSPPFAPDRPYYEIHGERLVAAGHYPEVIRYRDHLMSLGAALCAAVAQES